MREVFSIQEVTPLIAQLLESVAAQSKMLDDPRTAAIRKVWEAVDKTTDHLRRWHAPEVHKQPNRDLVRLWNEAALAIAVFDSKLAKRLRLKARHWSAPEHWSDKEVEMAGIGIDRVADEARDLLDLAQSSRSPSRRRSAPTSGDDEIDVFISHASEDKKAIAEPLAFELSSRHYNVWLDRYELELGDSLRREIDKGLRSCRYGVVILSHNFFAKRWPQLELDGLMALEDSDGRKRILPVLYEITHEEITSRYSPIISTRISSDAFPSGKSVKALADRIARAMQDGN